MRAADNATNLEIANKRLAANGQPPLPAKCKPGDPCAKSKPSDRHPAGGGVGPWQVGWEWLTGTGPKHRNFGPSHEFTQLLRSHQHYRAWVDKLSRQDLHVGDEFVNNYALSGVEGVGKYIVDYSTLLTGGAAGNLAVTYLGSHTASATVIAKNPDGSSVVRFVAENFQPSICATSSGHWVRAVVLGIGRRMAQ